MMVTLSSRYLGNYLDNLFAGAWDPQDTKPLKVNIPFANHDLGELSTSCK